MGTFSRFRFSPDLVERYPVLIETGTGHGAGVRHALSFPFREVHTVETEPELVAHARRMFVAHPHVVVHEGESTDCIRLLLEGMKPELGVVFWLDAHFPGYISGKAYDSEVDDDRRLPLVRELELIRTLHPNAIVLIDDLRLYHAGPFADGNVGLDHVGLTTEERRRAAVEVYGTLVATHDHAVFYDETGYLVVTPHSFEGGLDYVEFTGREYCEMARNCREVGDVYGAKAAYRKVVDLTNPPDAPWKRVARGEACRFFAAEAHEASKTGAEFDWFDAALSADPICVEYRTDFVNHTLLPLQLVDLARQEASKACVIAESFHSDDLHLLPRAWQTAANVEREAGDAEAAERCVNKALEVGGTNPGSHLMAAQFYADTTRWDDAIHHYELAAALGAHRRSEAIHGIGIVHDRMGDTEKALSLLDQALEMGGGDQTLLRWNRAEMLLTLGRYEEGWSDHDIRFDDRYRGRELAAFGRLGRRFKVPIWTPDDEPCRVHVHPEMGFGDVICMARYLPMVQTLGHDVRFEVKSHMVDLFARSLPGVKVQEFAIDYPGALGLSEFDRHITTMSFPHVFGTTIDTVPWNGPYVKADPARIATWQDRFQVLRSGCKPNVGLCWSAGIRPGLWYGEYGSRKSTSFRQLAPLWDNADVECFSLQAGPERLENSILPGIEGESPDWADTAALIANLDLVITVDTAVAHLAGAMGKPVWLMMHTQGSWHWMRDRTDSPWYPSVRIFRQKVPHEWSEVVSQVRHELDGFVPPATV